MDVFAKRIWQLRALTVTKSEDPATRIVIKQESEGQMLAALQHGLQGKVGEITRFAFPKTFKQALEIAKLHRNGGAIVYFRS